MPDTLKLLWNFILSMPLGLKVVYIGLLILACSLTWTTITNSRDPRTQFYNGRINYINKAFNRARKKDKAIRAEALANTFAALKVELELEFGEDYTTYTTGQRSIMIHLLTRYRDHMYFMDNVSR